MKNTPKWVLIIALFFHYFTLADITRLMKHFIIVFLAGIVTLTIVLAIYRVDVLEDIWLWLIGLLGPIIGFSQFAFERIQQYLKKFDIKS